MMLKNNNKEKSINNPLLSELFKVGLSVEMLISQCLRYVFEALYDVKHKYIFNINFLQFWYQTQIQTRRNA